MFSTIYNTYIKLGFVSNTHLIIYASLLPGRDLRLSQIAIEYFNNHANGETKEESKKERVHSSS